MDKTMKNKLCKNGCKKPVFNKKRELCKTCCQKLSREVGLLLKSESESTKNRNDNMVKKYGIGILRDFEDLQTRQFWNLTDIGKKHGFSREYARQIYKRLYGRPYLKIKKEKTVRMHGFY